MIKILSYFSSPLRGSAKQKNPEKFSGLFFINDYAVLVEVAFYLDLLVLIY